MKKSVNNGFVSTYNLLQVLFLGTCFLFLSSILYAQPIPELVPVPGGSFMMGDNHFVGNSDEHPTHTITVDDFEIGKTEVTVLQWKYYCEQVKKELPEAPAWGWVDDHPIVNITWGEANAYCAWLSKDQGKEYRLPTEAEWEYAAKGGKNGKQYKYSGAQWPDTVAWYSSNSKNTTHPVATKKPNELGIYDMTGNALEWCSDYYNNSYFTKAPQHNPKGPEAGTSRVVKGGAYSYNASICRTAFRNGFNPGLLRVQLGFRVVRSVKN